MRLRYVIPMTLFAYAWRDEEFALNGTFDDGGLRITYSFTSSEPTDNTDLAIPFSRMIVCDGLQIETNDGDTGILRALAVPEKWDALVAVLSKVANRILRAVRNIGISTNVAEIRLEPIAAESYLREWHVIAVEAGGESELASSKRTLFEDVLRAVFSGMEPRYGELFAVRWPAIQDAVRENREPGPGQEFMVNAMEHVRRGNLRYALLEAVIALEIAMTSFMRVFLSRRGIPKSRIDHFLSPQLTLHDRLAILLRLTIRPGDLDEHDVDLAIAAIKWRNHVVHRYGKIPAGIPDETIRQGIWAAIRVAGFLETRYQELSAEPEMQAVVNEMREELGRSLATPSILLRTPEPHHYVADIVYIADVLPDRAGLQAIVDSLADKLLKRDGAFDNTRRFYVRFIVFPNNVRATWMNGDLRIVEVPPGS